MCVCDCESSPSPSRAPTTTTLLAGRQGHRGRSASTPSSGPTTTSRWATSAACPARPTPGSRWPAWPARLRASGSGTLVSPATFRYPGPLAISVAQVDQMSGGRVELGLGAGWFDAEHAAYAIPFPALGERFDRLEEQLAIITGLWETPEGEQFSFGGKLLHGHRLPGAAEAVQQPAAAGLVGGGGRQAHAPARRSLRRRVQRAVPRRRGHRHGLRAGPGRVRGGRPRRRRR